MVNLTTGTVRLSYVHLFQSHKMNEASEAKYSVQIVIPKSDKVVIAAIKAAIQEECDKVAKSKYNGKLPKNFAIPLHDADEKAEENGEKVALHLKGCYYMNVSNAQKPQCVLRDKTPAEDGEIYSGCYGRVNLNLSAYDVAGKKGVGAYVNAVMFMKDGERLDGGVSIDDAFGDDEYDLD